MRGHCTARSSALVYPSLQRPAGQTFCSLPPIATDRGCVDLKISRRTSGCARPGRCTCQRPPRSSTSAWARPRSRSFSLKGTRSLAQLRPHSSASNPLVPLGEKDGVRPEVGPTSAVYSSCSCVYSSCCIPAGMHWPTCIFWTNLTPFSIWQEGELISRDHRCCCGHHRGTIRG